MNVLVYNGEKFQRGKIWYLVFVVIFAAIILFSVLSNNIVGAVLMFFLLGGYFYYSTINNQVIKMRIDPKHFIIGSKTYLRTNFRGYVLEVYPETQELKNIVFLTTKGHMIYTFHDSLEQVGMFLAGLDKFLPMLDTYDQGTFERMSRKLKL